MTFLARPIFSTYVAPPGSQSYTTAGTYTWVVPAGVTKVSVLTVGGGGQGGGRRRGMGGNGAGKPFPPPKSAWSIASLVLGCPTATSVRINCRPSSDIVGEIEYKPAQSGSFKSGPIVTMQALTTAELTLNGLKPDTEYSYHLRYKSTSNSEFKNGPDYRFHTQRKPGSDFTFEIIGDSHPERTPKQNEPALYEQTLVAAANDKPDFFMTIGDDFSVDTLNELNQKNVDGVYLKQLPYLGLVGSNSPLFLVNGNHEQASGANLDGTPDNVAVWAQNSKNKYFPLPKPDGFFTGDEEKIKHIGLLGDYYSWTWGDALFVVIDPYWHSKVAVDNPLRNETGKTRDLWEVTLGDAQYKWLKTTLENSHSKFKFVFAHHVLGTGRGGIERAPYFEWGGKSQRMDWEFDKKRPGWELPVHQLMVKNHVTIFFQGHDHVFCHQKLDGLTYQSLSEPGDATYTLYNNEAYRTGDTFPNSGRVKVAVNGTRVKVEYIRSYLPADATKEHPNGEVAFSYEIPASSK